MDEILHPVYVSPKLLLITFKCIFNKLETLDRIQPLLERCHVLYPKLRKKQQKKAYVEHW